ncbi:MAG: metallophosphoesterase [Paracoccaceae bacterium]|nr:metallophosphoesterase [Paracoccaceae bacterium]
MIAPPPNPPPQTPLRGFLARLRHALAKARVKARGNEGLLSCGPLVGPVYVVGDIHGCNALYQQMETRIAADARSFDTAALIVLLGDMIDNGPDSAGLVDHLTAPAPAGLNRLCLRGNHEDMMLDFLRHPRMTHPWLRVGGYETLMSYGLRLKLDAALPSRRLRHLLLAHIPQAHRAFLEQLPLGVLYDGYALVHAAIDPRRPLARQPRETLLWGGPVTAALPGLTVVHGHTIVTQVAVNAPCIGVDTGAHKTGRLSAVRLLPGGAPPALLEVPDA